MEHSNHSTVIIGSGISGLYAALKLGAQGADVLLATKSKLGESNSRYAQGGMVGVMKDNTADSVQSHVSDTIKAGAGLSEFNAVKFISEKSDAIVRDLLEFGVDFDRSDEGEFKYTLEAAHSVNRVLHSGGDATGRMIEEALCRAVRANDNIEVREKTTAVELLVENNECRGVILFDGKNYETVYASAIILATGGIGQLYKYTTNPAGATGDGIALAHRAGAVLQDMEFVQFHPTALAIDKERFLISEAVRGEGAKLVDADENEFMHKYHPQKELAPRDVVTRAIFNEGDVFLDASCIDSEKLKKRFPNIYKKCLEHGVDISRDLIPVAPAAHYFMGGIKTNLNGETSVKNLFAIGETASTGLHGANRLASNSLLECVVCAAAVAEHLKNVECRVENVEFLYGCAVNSFSERSEVDHSTLYTLHSKLQEIMWEYAGIVRSEESLLTAASELENLHSDDYELRNMIDVAKIIVRCALARKESRGAHFRTDYPELNETGAHSTIQGESCLVK